MAACLFWREKLPPLEEFHLDLHGSGNFYFFTKRLEHGLYENYQTGTKCAYSYLLIFIHKFILFCLDNKCYNYIYYVFIHVFIKIFGVYCGLCIEVECIYSNCISNIYWTCIYFYLYNYSYLLTWILFSFIQYM